ncbi:MAG: DNA polymerase III subunit delta [Ruminococcaceae bacterium]|nr:DNA polymerase III subunit delta [Oscillospiraceae bacterium]
MAKKEVDGLTVADMNNHIKNGAFAKVYLFHGCEEYLKDFYINSILDSVIHGDTLNFVSFDGKITASQLNEACDTIPMFGDKIAVLVRNSGVFKLTGDKTSEFDFVATIPDEVCLIFRETEIDKRNKLYKIVSDNGIVFECARQPENMIGKILARHANKMGCRITVDAVSLLVAGIGDDLLRLIEEANKLALYVGEGGEIDENAVRNVCALSVSATVFNLTDSLADNDREKSYKFLQTLLDDRVEPRYIFSMISNNYIKLYDTKQLLEKGVPQSEIAKRLGVVEFVAKKLCRQCRACSLAYLKDKINLCAELDMDSKSGRIDDITMLNILIGN